jgi:hypothetical protein
VWGTTALVGLSLLALLIAAAVTIGLAFWEWPYIGLVVVLCIAAVVAVIWRRRELPDNYTSD